MKILVASPEPGAGMRQALASLSPMSPMYCYSVRDFYFQQHRHDVSLCFGFPYYALPSTTPKVWYCLEPPAFRLYHKRREKYIGPIEKWRVEVLSECIVADKANANRFWEIYGIHPKVVPYGIDYGFWSQTPPPIDDGVFTVAHIAEIQQFKNQMQSVLSFAEFHKDVPASRLWLIGIVRDKKYFNEMMELVDSLGLNDAVKWYNQEPREDLRDVYYPRIDCVLHPIKLQGGFLTPLEAAAANRPVIVSQQCSCSDIIYKNYLGLVSSDSYSFWLKYIYDNGYVPRREWIQENLTWEKYCDGIKSILEGVV